MINGNEEKIREIEIDVRDIKSSLVEVVTNFKNMNEKLSSALDSHDKVIRLEERQKVNEKRIGSLESEIKENEEKRLKSEAEIRSKMTNIAIKVATMSGAISFIIGLLGNFAK